MRMRTSLQALAGVALLWTSFSSPVLHAAPHRPERPQLPVPTPPPNYSGLYGMTYLSLSGDVEVCVSLGPQRSCAPLTVDVPLYNGQATPDSLMFIVDALVLELETLLPNLPSQYYPSFDALVEVLFPAMVEELNLILGELPTEMDLRSIPGSPLLTAQLTVYGVPALVPGQIAPETGVFQLVPDVLRGTIDASRNFSGRAIAEVPVRVSQSVGVETPAGDSSTFEIALHGILGASMALTRD